MQQAAASDGMMIVDSDFCVMFAKAIMASA
jgi:hypothetical protein